LKISVNVIGGPAAKKMEVRRFDVNIEEGKTIKDLYILLEDEYFPWLKEEVGDVRQTDEIKANILIGNLNIKWLNGWQTKLNDGDVVTITTMYPRRVK
jgi:molybdopterin converting factor small subunit